MPAPGPSRAHARSTVLALSPMAFRPLLVGEGRQDPSKAGAWTDRNASATIKSCRVKNNAAEQLARLPVSPRTKSPLGEQLIRNGRTIFSGAASRERRRAYPDRADQRQRIVSSHLEALGANDGL